MTMISWKFPFLVKQVKCLLSYNGHITLQRKRWYTNNTIHPATRGRVLCKTFCGYITTWLSITCCKTRTIHNKRQSNDQSKLRKKVHSPSASGKIHGRYQAREGACGTKSPLVLPTSDWLREWREIFQPITWDSNWISRDKNYDFDSRLKRALNCYMNYHGNVACENIRFSSLFAGGDFREEERLRLRGRNSILMTQITSLHDKLLIMGFQI